MTPFMTLLLLGLFVVTSIYYTIKDVRKRKKAQS